MTFVEIGSIINKNFIMDDMIRVGYGSTLIMCLRENMPDRTFFSCVKAVENI